jgi:hypothetical protein
MNQRKAHGPQAPNLVGQAILPAAAFQAALSYRPESSHSAIAITSSIRGK